MCNFQIRNPSKTELTYIKERILGGRFFLSPEHTEVCEEFKKEVQRQRRLLYIVNFLLRT